MGFILAKVKAWRTPYAVPGDAEAGNQDALQALSRGVRLFLD
jgi:hypothetical protein